MDVSNYFNLRLIGFLAKIIPEKCTSMFNYEEFIETFDSNDFISNRVLVNIYCSLGQSPQYFEKAATILLKICADNRLIFTEYTVSAQHSEIHLQQNSLAYDFGEKYTFIHDRRNWRNTITSDFAFQFSNNLYYIEPEIVCKFLKFGLSSDNAIERKITIEIILELLHRFPYNSYITSFIFDENLFKSSNPYRDKIIELFNTLYMVKNPITEDTVLGFCHQLRGAFIKEISVECNLSVPLKEVIPEQSEPLPQVRQTSVTGNTDNINAYSPAQLTVQTGLYA